MNGVDPGTVCDVLPEPILEVLRLIVIFIQIGVPIILVVLGMVDLGKAVMQQKEDDIKEAQQLFIKRLLAAALVFFIVVIISLFLNLLEMVLGDQVSEIIACMQQVFDTFGFGDGGGGLD